MDFDLKLKALNRLAQSETEAAEAALKKELDKVAVSLDSDTQYDRLEQHIQVLDAIGYRFSGTAVEILLKFIQQIESTNITYLQQDFVAEVDVKKYFNASSLIVRAAEALIGLRYLETKTILHTMLMLSQHASDDVRKKAIEGLKALATYDIKVFYGDGTQPGIGAMPQKRIIDEIEALTDADLKQHFGVIASLVDGLLSPTMHGTSWSYKTITFSRNATPAFPAVADIRLRSIRLLKRMFGMAVAASEKLQVIGVLNDATRTDGFGQRDDDAVQMIVRDSIKVLDFFASLVPTEDLPIIQKIEHHSYWIFYHAIRGEIETAAIAVQTAISKHPEYQIYKILIGFEGIFGNWPDLKKTGRDWEDSDNFRKTRAAEFATNISPENYTEWRQRILRYAKTQSNDLATFPVFYYFLESFASAQPTLAFQLVSEDSEEIDGFLVPLLRSLWAGSHKNEIKGLVNAWAKQGRYLSQCARQFLANENFDLDVLALLLRKAIELEDINTVITIISVAVSNFSEDKKFLIDDLFIPALEVLTEQANANWIFDFWFRREARTVMCNLGEPEIDLVLRNLLALKEIDYHAEEVLFLIAQRIPKKVLLFLCQRLSTQAQKTEGGSSTFDAIPYKLHKLHEPLSKIPEDAVRVIRDQYDGNYQMFIFRGARLLKIIFPQFSVDFEVALLNIVREGGNASLEFVLAILRNYEGEPFIHSLCKQIVKSITLKSPLRTEVAVALESTGVVTGEFGFAEAFERKKNEIADWLTDPDAKVQEFAKWYATGLEQMSAADRKRAEEEIALRRYKYGEHE